MKGAAPRQRCWASLGLGFMLAGIALIAMRIDLINNYEFGAQISPELGLVMGLAAVALTALPAAAALLGEWDMLLRIGTILVVMLTVLAAISAYSEKQGAQILARKADNATYEAAQRDAEAARAEIMQARAEAARIAETASVAELDVLVTEAKAKADREQDRKGCGLKCEAAKADHVALVGRLGEAKAKSAALDRAKAAQSTLDRAKIEARAGPAEASMLATIIAGQTGYAAENIARAIALGTTTFSIAVTLVMALLMHSATALIMKGLGVARQEHGAAMVTRKPELAPAPVEPAQHSMRRPTDKARPVNDLRAIAEARVLLFAQECLRPGGETVGEAMAEAVARWWNARYPNAPVPSMNVVSKVLLDAGLQKAKRHGRMTYSAALAAPSMH